MVSNYIIYTRILTIIPRKSTQTGVLGEFSDTWAASPKAKSINLAVSNSCFASMGWWKLFCCTAIYRYTLLLMEGNHANPFRLVFDSIICRVLYIPGGAGFLSSTGFTLLKTHWNKSRRFPHRPINGDQMLIDPFGRNENITLNTSKQSMTLCKISQGSWVALGHWKKKT